MTKDETRQLKGLAILLMLWLHLFSNEETVRHLSYWFCYVNGQPLAYALTRLASCCVAIYILLGGYGLAMSYLSAPGHRLHGRRRALALMANFWLVFVVFVPLGCWLNPGRYPADAATFVLNLLGISYSYNGAWWFLLPYVLLTLSAQPLMRRLFAHSARADAGLVAVLCVVEVLVYVVIDTLVIDPSSPLFVVVPMLNYAGLLLLFCIGALMTKYRLMERARQRLTHWPRGTVPLLLAGLCMVKMLLGGSSLLNIPFVLLALPLLHSLWWPQWLRRGLHFLGGHSTNMWLVHFFYYYIFGTLIYRLHTPVVIFLCLTGVSLGVSMILKPLFEPLRQRIRRSNS